MINIKHKIKAPSKIVKKIFGSKSGKRHTILSNISEDVRHRLVDYLSHRRILHELRKKNYRDDEKKALEHCYESKTSALSNLKKDMIKSIKEQNPILLSRCPYCLVREPNTWDHYMPISKYPEYSVYSPNLIWVCGICNNTKSDRFVEGEKEVIHTYFDKLPDEALLKCDIVVDHSNVPIMTFHVPNPHNINVIDSLRKHFVALSLADLYIRESTPYISVLLKEIALRYPNGLTDKQFKKELGYKYDSISEGFGNNHWQIAVLKGMIRCVELIRVIDALRVTHNTKRQV